jgi:20S proteasome alpha/beta subunit
MKEQSITVDPQFDPYCQERMGTTILAVKFNGGVIAAADTRKLPM